MVLVRNVRDGAPPARSKPAPVKIVVAVKPAAAPAKVADATPSPFNTYSKGTYRVVDDGDQLRVDMWGDVTSTWTPTLRFDKAKFRVEETPVAFKVFHVKPGDGANRDPAKEVGAMDRTAMSAHLRSIGQRTREQIEGMNQAARERWSKRK